MLTLRHRINREVAGNQCAEPPKLVLRPMFDQKSTYTVPIRMKRRDGGFPPPPPSHRNTCVFMFPNFRFQFQVRVGKGRVQTMFGLGTIVSKFPFTFGVGD